MLVLLFFALFGGLAIVAAWARYDAVFTTIGFVASFIAFIGAAFQLNDYVKSKMKQKPRASLRAFLKLVFREFQAQQRLVFSDQMAVGLFLVMIAAMMTVMATRYDVLDRFLRWYFS